MQQIKSPTHPCLGCIYFKACGETNRTMPCEGRMTKSQKKATNCLTGVKSHYVERQDMRKEDEGK